MNTNDKDFDEILMENGEEPGEMPGAVSDEPTEGIVEGEILTTGSLAKFLGLTLPMPKGRGFLVAPQRVG